MSNELKPLFPAYLNSLKLRTPQGMSLTLDAAGNGSFKNWVMGYVLSFTQCQVDAGKDMSKYSWLNIQGGRVRSLDFDAFIRYADRMKLPPAFDALDFAMPSDQGHAGDYDLEQLFAWMIQVATSS